jgi:hypothetical protein
MLGVAGSTLTAAVADFAGVFPRCARLHMQVGVELGIEGGTSKTWGAKEPVPALLDPLHFRLESWRTDSVVGASGCNASGFVRQETRAKHNFEHSVSPDCFAAIEAASRSFCRGSQDAFCRTCSTPVYDHLGVFLLLSSHRISILKDGPLLTHVTPDSFPPGAGLARVQEPLRPEVSTHYTALEPSRTADNPSPQRCDRGRGGREQEPEPSVDNAQVLLPVPRRWHHVEVSHQDVSLRFFSENWAE